MRFPIAAVVGLLALAACVSFPDAPSKTSEPAIVGERLRAFDGAMLGLQVWRAEKPIAAIIAVHGMNDYSGHFRDAAEWWSKNAAITVYAYDQRGFGRSPEVGRWAGKKTLVSDLNAAIAAVHVVDPGLPVFVLGHSMGGSVVLAAGAEAPLDVDGAILAAPGIWGGSQMPIAYRIALNISAGVAPGKTLTGERAGRQASDNIAALREMWEDPLVIKPTRLDAVLGVERIMGDAWKASGDVGGDILFLTGEKDEIIPPKKQKKAAKRLCGDIETRDYPEGWHLLLRDLEAERVYRDVAEWVAATAQKSKSAAGVESYGPAALLCAK